MRVTDHRYARDLLRHDLALRMIRHEARTCTIRLCTGLTDDRIRKLYRTYIETAAPADSTVRRKRGKSPRQVGYFTRNTLNQLEASLLAGIFAALGLLAGKLNGTPAITLEFGELFCDAFETYQQCWHDSRLSFEHAWCLLLALVQGEDLALERCPRCAGIYVQDIYMAAPPCCPLCRLKQARA